MEIKKNSFFPIVLFMSVILNAQTIPNSIIDICKVDNKVYQLIVQLNTKLEQNTTENPSGEVFITNTNRYTKKGDEVKGVNKLLKVISYRPINETVNLDIEIRENNFEEKNKRVYIFLYNRSSLKNLRTIVCIYDKEKNIYVLEELK